MSRDEVVSKANQAVDGHSGPVYRWWLARALDISVPTLRNYLDEYHLDWPPPWPFGTHRAA
jgi:hypothetical protein